MVRAGERSAAVKQLNEKDFLQELNTGLTPGENSDKWSVFEPNDGMVDSSKGVSPSIGLHALVGYQKEVALADSVMSASVLSSPPKTPCYRPCWPESILPIAATTSANVLCPPRIALAGDAAHSLHPQAGQGLNLGLGDARCLSETIAAALRAGSDIGDTAVLKPYAF